MTIEQICRKYRIENYTINDDGTIDVNGDVDLYKSGLTELPLTFNNVSGWFDCGENFLTSLKGCPRWVSGDFHCSENKLTSLEFSPDYVGGFFECCGNKLLMNTKGCSEKIYGLFYCSDTPIASIFDSVDRNFLHAFNFYKIIKEDTVNLKRLKYVMDLYDKPIDLDKIQKYYRLV